MGFPGTGFARQKNMGASFQNGERLFLSHKQLCNPLCIYLSILPRRILSHNLHAQVLFYLLELFFGDFSFGITLTIFTQLVFLNI
jgi:hypothetical protein